MFFNLKPILPFAHLVWQAEHSGHRIAAGLLSHKEFICLHHLLGTEQTAALCAWVDV
jgi:hypothetical protein